jgi:hypothetical protein
MIRCIRFQPDLQNTRQGYADFELTKVGLIIRRCIWHKQGKKEWVAFHAHREDDGTWTHIVQFADSAQREQFRTLAVEAIHDFFAKQGHKQEAGGGGDP